jgi:flavin reductase (DIM6/NTAB) family NADH-FMN oxidoreductase RutF
MSTADYRSAARSLVTTVALITTVGRHGRNAMSAEWTYLISYNPMRLVIGIHPSDATYDNLIDSGEFGANFLSDDQGVLANLGGAYTGKEVSKLSSDLFKIYPAEKIKPPMLSGCFLNAECRLINDNGLLNLGDHAVFVGEVVHLRHDPRKKPLLYSQRSYWQVGDKLERKPLLYVTCTARDGSLRVDGRLSGVETYPQAVEVEVASDGGRELVAKSLRTDEYGYFELTGIAAGDSKSQSYHVKARWNERVGSASSAAGT